MKDFAIVVVAFNRLPSLRRLMSSLIKADYNGDQVDIILSIDFSGKADVADYAAEIDWPFGKKIVIEHKKNLGLRKHILLCGELTEDYRFLCVLEDDLYVSPAFYKYAKSASEFYEDDDNVAGISLYTHLWNYLADAPFVPLDDGFDVFFLQQAMSWGQVWTKCKWDRFTAWYEINKDKDLASPDFPLSISNWPKSSWLKYHTKYIVEENRYFVYPRVSLCTNFSDAGTHAMSTNTYQVPLQMSTNKHYSYQRCLSTSLRYDVFFESLNMDLDGYSSDLTVDLYATKVDHKRYWLTMRRENFKIVKEFGLGLRPIELNITEGNQGADIFLYDTLVSCKNSHHVKSSLNFFFYNIRTSARANLLLAGSYLYFSAIKKVLRKAFHF